MIEKKFGSQILLSEIEEDDVMVASTQVSSIESKRIDDVLVDSNADVEEQVSPMYEAVPSAADEVSSVRADISPALNDTALYKRLSVSSEMGKFKASIGSTDAPNKVYLVDDDDTLATEPYTDISDDEHSEVNEMSSVLK